MSGARASWRRRFQLWLIGRLRSSRVWPAGLADKRTDLDRLGQRLPASVMVFFGSSVDALYQLRPWLPALSNLNEMHPVSLVFRDSRVAGQVRAESGLDCITLSTYGQLDQILSVSDVKLALYVNPDPINFESLRFTSLIHVYLGHGDSDKGVSVSNQVKAYDYCFLAGQAAIDRTSSSVMAYDAVARSVLIGQPQLDAPPVTGHPDPARPTILYAPTWEGSQPSVSYGSAITHGHEVVTTLKDAYRVIYRPHPLSGVADAEYGQADAALREIADRVDTDVTLEQSFADADLLITDVSAVTLNWLPTGKPVMVTESTAPKPPSPLMQALPLLSADADVAAAVRLHLETDPTADARRTMIEHYLGDTTPGVATARFIQACTSLIEQRDAQWAAQQAQGATGP
ncbi:MAG: glycosyl transferase [Actinomycetales bacterium]|nr:glycosyl transferase [Actinomycetales bacterium]